MQGLSALKGLTLLALMAAAILEGYSIHRQSLLSHAILHPRPSTVDSSYNTWYQNTLRARIARDIDKLEGLGADVHESRRLCLREPMDTVQTDACLLELNQEIDLLKYSDDASWDD